MLLVQAAGLSFSYADRLLWSGVNFRVETGDRIGLIGANGTGKTTLFNVLMGEAEPSGGQVVVSKDVKLSCVEQHACAGSRLTVYNEMLTVFSKLSDMEAELSSLHDRIDSASGVQRDVLIERQTLLTDSFTRDGGLTYKARARSALLGLGFGEDELTKPVSVLSGGQRTKLSLAKLLNSGADLILLDEPTNHLDLMSVEWLEDFLSHFRGAALIVSHDRYFLDRTTTKTMEIRGGSVTVTDGSYSRFCELRLERELSEGRERDKGEAEIRRIEGIIAQQKRFNRERNYITIASKEKQIERIRAALPPAAPVSPGEISFRFEAGTRSGDEVVIAHDLSKSFPGSELFTGVDLDIRRGERAFFIGPNGCGKTTLLRILTGKTRADSGYCRFGTGVVPGYFDQNGAGLDSHRTVIEEVYSRFPIYDIPHLRSLLARFMFRADEINKMMDELSGGERARVALLLLMLGKPNLLILDEPTNHLDIDSREVLESALSGYDGTVVAVSHDRYFINKLASQIYMFAGGTVKRTDGGYDDCVEAMRGQAAPASGSGPAPVRGGQWRERKELESARRKRASRIGRIEEEISAVDARSDEINRTLADPETASDYVRVTDLTRELTELSAREEDLYAEYLELSGEEDSDSGEDCCGA